LSKICPENKSQTTVTFTYFINDETRTVPQTKPRNLNKQTKTSKQE
jgi:hypothetical protein